MRRGMTLIELSIAMALLAVIGYLGLAFLGPTARSFTRTSVRAGLQQEALTVGNRMAGDLARTAACSLNYHNSTGPNDPTVLGLVPLKDVDAEGRQIWDDTLVAYVWTPATRRVVRRVWRTGDDPALTGVTLDPQLPTWPPEDQLVTLGNYDTPMKGDEVLATQVTRAHVSSPIDPPNIQLPLRLELRLEQWAQDEAAESFEIARDLGTRNNAQMPVAKPTTPLP